MAEQSRRDHRSQATTGLEARRAALAALRAVDEHDAFSNLAVPAAVSLLRDARDRSFASHLAYDTLRWQGTLDWALEHVLDRPLTAVEPALQRLLRLGALQLLHSHVPPRAAVATTVELAREAVPKRRTRGAAAFVNGVLRALGRRQGLGQGFGEAFDWPDPVLDPVANLALTTAHPPWMAAELLQRLGPAEARRALEADNVPPGLTLRAVGDRDELIAELRSAGVDALPGGLAPEAVRARGADPRSLAAVEEGRAVPQDEASMLVVHATRVRDGDRVLDLCAGPGGKTTHLATLAGPRGEVVAVELYPGRAELIVEAAAKVGVAVDVRVGDGTDPPVEGTFDVVLVDAPCTGIGTGRRRPEIRWRRTPQDAHELADLQRRLLAAGAERVRPGGHLTYAACTWTATETTAIVHDFLGRTSGARTGRTFGARTGRTFGARPALSDRFALVEESQRWPHHDGTDGMYHATLRRQR
ncbi:MAG: methyltransferase domain-containing protein [Actinomycetota bacterium]|nr:methyltransferase domain-containing protein [Actinomycetota bacterium]